MLEVMNAKQKQKEKSTEVLAKLWGYGRTNIPVEGKIKVMCEFQDDTQISVYYVLKTDFKTELSLQTCKILGMIQLLHEVTSKEDQKQEPTGASMERVDIEKKVKMITGKSPRKHCSKQS